MDEFSCVTEKIKFSKRCARGCFSFVEKTRKIAVRGVVKDAVAGVLKDVEICRQDVYKVV